MLSECLHKYVSALLGGGVGRRLLSKPQKNCSELYVCLRKCADSQIGRVLRTAGNYERICLSRCACMHGLVDLAKTLIELSQHGLSCRNIAPELFFGHDDLPRGT